MIPDQATQRQNTAADPRASTWLSANAGSGKTRVLTNRVARLLLAGVEPQNILCLTYTKAAAAEMQNRLFETLGKWAMMENDALRTDLRKLGEDDTITDQQLRGARQLFARAIEAPGGLKIQTIHSFCSGVLRRFPLEAGISPAFKEMDDVASKNLRAEVMDQIATGSNAPVLDTVLIHFSGAEVDELSKTISASRDKLAQRPDDRSLRASLGLADNLTEDALVEHVFMDGALEALRAWLPILQKGSATEATAAAHLAKMNFDAPTLNDIELLESFALTKSGKAPFTAKIGSFPTKDTRKAHPELTEDLNTIMQAVEDVRQDRLALLTYRRTRALYDFADVFLPAFAERKQALGLLDFDDLIDKTRDLLTDRAVAQWVLFRLDGGIDHVLVDEAQDTSPTQWDVIRLLTQEFTAGVGARADRDRTIFVVGDQKQSIYSFQGAAPEAFDEMRAHFRQGLDQAGQRLEESVNLEHSFRSSQAILRAVDQTFTDPTELGTNDASQHMAFKDVMPGRVDVWPIVEKAEVPEDTPWYEPIDQPAQTDEFVRLAEQVASQIKHMIEHETLPVEIENTGRYNHRPITAGDFLILVRGRKSGLFQEIIRACKSADLDIAGADRLRVGGELAVRDILALLNFLALPEDDLSLACALRSPLFGWSEQDLYSLAQPRGKDRFLWEALRGQPEHAATLAMLRDLRKQADFLRPFDLIERILTRHDGRRNLLARLGPEAEDGIDALLTQALNYEGTGVPGLTGFLAWVAADDLEIKRQMDSQGDKIRVMTVHGAKGLEAPIVILPDCAAKQPKDRHAIYPTEDHAIWPPAKAQRSDAVLDLQSKLAEAEEKETNRLLYVAMTRAEAWLIIAAAGDPEKQDGSWYHRINSAMEHIGAEDAVSFGLPVTRHQFGKWDVGDLVTPETKTTPTAYAPDFGPVIKPTRASTLTPSSLPGAKVLTGDHQIETEEEAKARGTAIHLLLEHLPLIPSDDWKDRARTILSSMDAGFADEDEIISQAIKVLSDTDLADLWSPDHLREVDISATLGDQRFHGTIDLLIVDAGKVIAVDFKTNRKVPDTPAQVPDGIMAQMAAYHTGLGQVFPDHQIEVAILWTDTPRLMTLPDDLISTHLDRVTLP